MSRNELSYPKTCIKDLFDCRKRKKNKSNKIKWDSYFYKIYVTLIQNFRRDSISFFFSFYQMDPKR